MLTQQEIDLISDSAAQLAEMNVVVTNTFYASLFSECPDLRPMFPEDMFDQSQKLWNSIVQVLETLDNLENAVPALRALGAAHVRYGAVPDHYGTVNRVLLQTLARLLTPDWTEDHAAAWGKALSIVSDTMISGAEAMVD